jgi:predicted aspartyl protease
MNGNKGELFFDIDLIATDGLVIDAMLDTGFTDWLAMDIQDIKSFGWPTEKANCWRRSKV